MSDHKWIEQLPTEVDKIPAQDVTTLAEMMERAENESDRRYLETVFAPIRRRWDLLEREHELRAELAAQPPAVRSAPLEQHVIQIVAARIREQHPELRGAEATQRAREQVQERWRAADAAQQKAVEEARAELGRIALARVAGDSSLYDPSPQSTRSARAGTIEAGREGARAERQARGPSPFEGFRMIGGPLQ